MKILLREFQIYIFSPKIEQTRIFSSLYFAIYCKYFKISKSKSQNLKYQNFTSSALSYDWIRKLDFEAIFRYFEKRSDRLVNDIKKTIANDCYRNYYRLYNRYKTSFLPPNHERGNVHCIYADYLSNACNCIKDRILNSFKNIVLVCVLRSVYRIVGCVLRTEL